MTGKNLDKFYKILDVTPDTPWEEIKRAYHDMIKVWHPDRFAGDPRLQKIVEEKTKELTHAFQKIEEDYHSIKFYFDPIDEAKEASIKTRSKPQTEPPAKEGKPKSSRYARKQEAEEWLKKAKGIETGNYRIVIDLLNKAIDLDPSLEEAYIERGEAHAMLGNHGQAVEDFNEVIELNSKSFKGFRGRANAYSELGNHSQAIIDFTSALELESVNYPELYYLRGKSHEKLGNRDEAKEDFKNAKVLGILSRQSHGSHTSSELDDEWKIEEKRRVSFKQIGLYVTAIICVLFGIIAFTLPIFLSKDNEKGEPKKEMTKGIVMPASPFSTLEKAVPVPAPLPISDYEKVFKTGKDKPRDDTRSIRQIKETGLTTPPLEREKPIKGRATEVTPAEKEDPSVKKKQGRIQRENNQRIFEKEIDRVKKGEIQDSGEKTITEAEKGREPEEKKAQQFEKLRKLEKEFPFEMIKER
ncbi:MAG: DnaJ domain-containing protein [Deltaproteobacteria bacterium]|nr:DnaJ domain-containing protein [Deltaproteobacteria bacterium]